MKTLFKKLSLSFKSLALMSLLLSSCVFGQENGASNIAVIDMATALFNSDIAQELAIAVEQETTEDQEKIRSLAEEATALQERYQQDEAIMSEDEKRRIAEDIQEIGVSYQYLVEKVETYVQQRRQQFQQTYAPNLIQALTEVIEENNFDLVLRSEIALHFNSAYDITAQVTAKLNQ